MKKIVTTALVLATSLGSAFAQNEKEPRALMFKGDDVLTGWIVAANDKVLRYKEKENSTVYRDLRLSTAKVYFLEPPEFTEAMELFKSRNYAEAKDKFEACAKIYKKVDEIKGNYSTLSTFYQMECLRKLEELAQLSPLIEGLNFELLARTEHHTQVKIYSVFWEAVRTKSWSRLDAIASDPEWRNLKVSGGLRAQMSYCQGLALEGIDKPIQALTAYNHAFVSDFAASEEITRKAALNCLRIIDNDDSVKLAKKLYNTEDHNPDSTGAFLIKEGIALIKLWDKTLGNGATLPANYKGLLKFPPKGKPQVTPKTTKEDKKSAKKSLKEDDKKKEK
ncbi:MAG TPA: hypothetical protein DDW68_02450 [Verrucomicrobiales bacterium]|nr:hypothetical protein [Verrucomicrobiales bacterium]